MKQLMADEMFYKHFWRYPCDCGYYYSEDKGDYLIYAKSKKIAQKASTDKKKLKFLFILWGILALVLIPVFILGYICFCNTGSLVIIGFVMAFSGIGLIGAIVTAFVAHHLQKSYKNEVIYLKKD